MYNLKIEDRETTRTWEEHFDSYYLFRKRYYKLKYSKRLRVIRHSNLVD